LKTRDRVLDIGCGAGATCVAAAERVGARGSVLGVDVSSPLPLRAVRRIEARGLQNVELAQVDAERHVFVSGAFDLAISRFGTMFFADPVLTFANIASALLPGGPVVAAKLAIHVGPAARILRIKEVSDDDRRKVVEALT